MKSKQKNKFFKNTIHWVLLVMASIWFLYLLFKPKIEDQGHLTDKTVTYKTITVTQTIPLDMKPSLESIVKSIPKYVEVPKKGVDWKIFAQTKTIPYSYTDENGNQRYAIKPDFSQSLKLLNGKNITMQGYMFPLTAKEKQSKFLFGPFPVSCPYHYHVGPTFIIEAHTLDEIEMQWGPINILGRLELIPQDEDYNIFYRLQNVELKK